MQANSTTDHICLDMLDAAILWSPLPAYTTAGSAISQCIR